MLLPDPSPEQERPVLNKKIETIARWGTENRPELDCFRKEIRKAFDGRLRGLDMFAGGGAISLKAMRLGCDMTAIDYNPVAYYPGVPTTFGRQDLVAAESEQGGKGVGEWRR